MEKIKVLVVDDSILFREVMIKHLQQDKMIEIVGKAGDAYSARDLILKYEPDVMTLDLEMPRMDGVNFLQKLLPQYYLPSVVVSSSDVRKTDCLSAGAVEFLAKPLSRSAGDMEFFGAELCKAVRRAYKSTHPNADIDVKKISSPTADPSSKKNNMSDIVELASKAKFEVSQKKQIISATHLESSNKSEKAANSSSSSSVKHAKIKRSEAIIALGASTGGTEALEQVLKHFPADTPPVIIVQHMPAGFTKMYSERLNRSCKMEVKEAVDGERLRHGLIVIGAGEYHLRLCKDARGWYVSSKPGEKVSGHCPSVDVMFNSVANVAGPLAIGAILTGMGRDGADGLLRMRQAGAFTVGQDRDTCVVYGMPMEAYNCGAVEVQAPLYKIADIILSMLI